MTITALRKSAVEWRDKLGLSEWTIHVAWGNPVDGDPDLEKGEMSRGCVGNTWWHTEESRAVIVLHRGQGLDTLIHEMLHIRIEGHRAYPLKYDPLYERAINCITAALMRKVD